jgi:hypothetical protein
VVTALVVPEPPVELVAGVDELVEPEPDEELAAEVPVELLDTVLAAALVPVTVAACVVTSWVKITPQSARNSATAIAITRVRILRTRRRFLASRSVAIRFGYRGAVALTGLGRNDRSSV